MACLSLGLMMTMSCTNSNSNKDDQPGTKENAEEKNAERFDNQGEKDADRLADAYLGNLYEIKASEDAAIKASTAEVKKTAAMMVEAHTKMNSDIKALASRKAITLPTMMTDEHQRKMEDLTKKTGLDYDKEYVDQMKSKHNDAERKLEKLADDANDQDIRTWAAAAVPEIRAHLDMLKATHENLKDMKNYKKEKNKWNDDHVDIHDGKDDIHTDARTKK